MVPSKNDDQTPPSKPVSGNPYRGLPRSIFALGLVSLLMDASSELVHGLLPSLMVTVLGASMVTVGLIEGAADATAAVVKVFSGVFSDYVRKRKLLALLGYGLAAIAKPVFPLATTIWWVFAARFIDRVGKGIREAPRDALVADIVRAELRGAAYGLRQALDSAGAFIGPLLAVTFMALLANDVKAVMWIAVLPACLAVLLLAVAVREPRMADAPLERGRGFPIRSATRLPSGYWSAVAIGAVFSLARFSDAFLILRAQNVGLSIGYAPLIMIAMNIVYAATAYPAGAAADRLPPRTLLGYGLIMLVVADIVLALATSAAMVFLGSALWGLHMGLTQGMLSKLVADAAPSELRGTAFGMFNLANAAALLSASVIAGSLWAALGPTATFLAGATFAALAAVGIAAMPAQIRS